jgi:hypothetical protein
MDPLEQKISIHFGSLLVNNVQNKPPHGAIFFGCAKGQFLLTQHVALFSLHPLMHCRPVLLNTML